jgi:tetratricopeptide (TPR) repeat protein
MDQFESYEDALQLSNTSGSREASSQMSVLLRRGSAEEACTLLALQRNAMRFDEVAEFEIELSRLYFERGEQAQGLTFGMAAISTVKERFPGAAIKYCDEVAGRLVILDANHEAIELLQDSLVRWPDSALLWKRIGTALWYDNQLLAGYAALSTSLALGTPRHLIFHPRGQVLAELGNYDRAIDELDLAIKHPTSIISQAYARSTQLYARFCRDGDLAVLSEYDELQQITPGNAWMFWFHARCRCIAGDIDLAVQLFRTSLESRSPALPPWKRAFAQEEIGRILDDNGS